MQKCLNVVRTSYVSKVFYIYFLEILSELGCIVENINSPLTIMLIKSQKLLTNRNCPNFLMFLHGVNTGRQAQRIRFLFKIPSKLPARNAATTPMDFKIILTICFHNFNVPQSSHIYRTHTYSE